MAVPGSNFLTDDVIMKEALMLLKNNLVAARLVYRSMERTFGKVGDSIRIKRPYRTKVASGRVLVKQPLVDRTIPFTINNQSHFGLEFTSQDRTLSIENFSERYLKSGICQIANQIDSSILATLQSTFFSTGPVVHGKPLTTPITLTDFYNAGALMSAYAVPNDGMRRAVLNPFTSAIIAEGISNKYQPEMVMDAIRRAEIGTINNFDTFESQNLLSHEVGNYGGTPLVNGAGQTGSSIVTDGWTPSVTGLLKKGDVITFAGVFGVNPQSYKSTGLLQQFVVTADVNSDASGNATIPISPELNDGSLTITNAQGQVVSIGAYQNVTNATADNAPIKVIGAPGDVIPQNYLFHRDSIGLAMIDIELPETAVVKRRVRDEDSGLSMTLTAGYDISEQSEIYRIDAIWGVHNIYPELGLRMWGGLPA